MQLAEPAEEQAVARRRRRCGPCASAFAVWFNLLLVSLINDTYPGSWDPADRPPSRPAALKT